MVCLTFTVKKKEEEEEKNKRENKRENKEKQKQNPLKFFVIIVGNELSQRRSKDRCKLLESHGERRIVANSFFVIKGERRVKTCHRKSDIVTS